MGRIEWYAGDVQVYFRRGRRTEDILFILERMIEMAKVRKECLSVAFIDMEKAYERSCLK